MKKQDVKRIIPLSIILITIGIIVLVPSIQQVNSTILDARWTDWSYDWRRLQAGQSIEVGYPRKPAYSGEAQLLYTAPSNSDVDFSYNWCPATPGEPTWPDGGTLWVQMKNNEQFAVDIHYKYRFLVPFP